MHHPRQSLHSISQRFSVIPAGVKGNRLLWPFFVLLILVSPGLTAETLVNINTASAMQLADSLPGIGPVKAKAIVAYREANGAFTRIDDLANVSGIGPATLNRLRPLITIDGADSADSESAPGDSGAAPIAGLSQQQMELMARAATRAAIQMAIEDARAQSADSVALEFAQGVNAHPQLFHAGPTANIR